MIGQDKHGNTYATRTPVVQNRVTGEQFKAQYTYYFGKFGSKVYNTQAACKGALTRHVERGLSINFWGKK